jgi:hypothetical protein
MKEFLLLMRTQGDCSETMSPEFHRAHLQKMIDYIGNLESAGKLIGAQPLSMNGAMLQGKGTTYKDGPFIESKEVIVGYFVFRAKDMEEASAIAREHPLLEDDPTARIEVREIKKEAGIN